MKSPARSIWLPVLVVSMFLIVTFLNSSLAAWLVARKYAISLDERLTALEFLESKGEIFARAKAPGQASIIEDAELVDLPGAPGVKFTSRRFGSSLHIGVNVEVVETNQVESSMAFTTEKPHSALWLELVHVEGVEEVQFYRRYSISITKSSAFEWSQVEPTIYKMLAKHLRGKASKPSP